LNNSFPDSFLLDGGNKKPSEESEGCVIETKTNDCPSCDGKENLSLYGFFIYQLLMQNKTTGS